MNTDFSLWTSQPNSFLQGQHSAPVTREAPANLLAVGGSSMDTARAGTLRRSVNRFSVFVKNGAEAYLLGTFKDKHVETPRMFHVKVCRGIDLVPWVNHHKFCFRRDLHGLKSMSIMVISQLNTAAKKANMLVLRRTTLILSPRQITYR